MMTLVAFIVAIAVLVVFHELGHYLVARWCDVKVLRFSVGFGKVIYAKRFDGGETEWVISAIPLGGYVKMLDEREGQVAEQELPRAFNRKPVLQRMAIVVAGPLANLLLAILLYIVLYVHGIPALKPILETPPADTPAAMAGLQQGQEILSINGQQTPSWQEVRWRLLELVLQQQIAEMEIQGAADEKRVVVLDLSHLSAADLDGDFMKKLGLQPYQPPVYPVLGRIAAGGAAERAGMQELDRILTVDGVSIPLWTDWVDVVRAHPGMTMQVEFERSGVKRLITLTPDAIEENGQQIGRIGAAAHIDKEAFDQMVTEVRYPFTQAVVEGVRKTGETALLSLKMMGKMVLGEVSIKNLSGPITIADYAGQSAQLGVGAYLGFLALISISLAVLNLLPIPLLDGGHLLYYSVELLKGSPVSDEIWEAGQKAGIALLVTMMAFALYNDISRLISG